MPSPNFSIKVFGAVERFFKSGGNNNDILTVACIGNPEKTIQGALFEYLSRNNFKVVSEMKLGGVSPDISVFESSITSSPDVVIELKHLSPFQTGGLCALIQTSSGKHDLMHDYNKHKGGPHHLILVGAATTMLDPIAGSSTFPFPSNKQYVAQTQKKCARLTSIRNNFRIFTNPLISMRPKNTFTLVDECTSTFCSSSTCICIGCTPTQKVIGLYRGTVHAIGYLFY